MRLLLAKWRQPDLGEELLEGWVFVEIAESRVVLYEQKSCVVGLGADFQILERFWCMSEPVLGLGEPIRR